MHGTLLPQPIAQTFLQFSNGSGYLRLNWASLSERKLCIHTWLKKGYTYLVASLCVLHIYDMFKWVNASQLQKLCIICPPPSFSLHFSGWIILVEFANCFFPHLQTQKGLATACCSRWGGRRGVALEPKRTEPLSM